MSPSNSKLSPDRETTSCIQNKNRKRSFFRTSKTDVTDNDIYNKRKKSIKHSQVEINNAVLTAQNGYMTRNKLKRQLTDNSELVETIVIEDECSRIDKIRNKSATGNKNRKPSKKIHKKMLQLGFVFTNDIFSPYPGKHLDTEYKKSTPSLFESDSDPEIDYFRIKDNTKNKVKEEISTCISYPDDICPTFNKNVEMRTYFNKKSYPINNKSNIISLNTFEEINQKPSSLYNHVKTVCDSNLYKNISQKYSKTNKSLEVTADSSSMSNSTTKNKPISIEPCKENSVNFNKNKIIDNVSTSNSKLVNLESCDQSYMHLNKNEISPTTSECVQTNSEDDETIVVTESFIRQLKNEFEIAKTESQAEIRTQKLFYDNNTNKSNDSDIEQNKENKVVSKILSSDFEVNEINMCTIDTNIDDICDVNFKSSISSNLLLKQDMNVIDDSQNLPSPSLFTTTNNVENSLMSIFDEPKENILVESYANINNSLIINSKSNSSTTISEEIIDLSNFHTFEFDNSNSDQPVENYPKPEKNISHNLSPDLIEPNQYFHTLIKDEIQIKAESFYIKENYNCSLKNDSLNSINNSFSKKNKNLSSNCYCKSFNSFNINDNKIFTSKIKHFAFNNNAKKVRQKLLYKKHLEANFLNMLITKEHKNIIQLREHNIPIFNSISINKKFEKCVDFKENDHIEPSILSMLKDVYVDVEYLTEFCDYNTSDHKLLEPQKSKNDIKFNIQPSEVTSIDIMHTFKSINDSTSNNTSQNKPINLKPYDEKYDNFNKNKINNNSTSNITKQKKTVYIKPFDGSYVDFNKKKTIDHANTSNGTRKNKLINLKSSNENDFNYDKYKINDNVSTPSNKSVNLQLFNQSSFNKNITSHSNLMSNSTTENKLISIEPCEQNGVKFNKNEITAIDCVSNTTAKNKPRSIEPGEQNGVKLNKNEITHSNLMSISTTENELMSIETCEQNGVKFNKNEITAIDCVSNTTTKNKPISIDPCEQNDVKFNKNEITHSNLMSISTTENELMSIETCEQNGVKFNKNEITAIDCVSNTTTKNKPISIDPCEQNDVKFNKNEITHSNLMSNSTTENELMSIETCEQNGVKFNKNEITAIDCVSNTTTKSKPISIDPCEQNDVKFNKNEITHSNLMSISTTENELMSIETCEQNGVKFNKNEITAIDCVSNTTTKNKPISIDPCEQNDVKFNKNEITHSNLMSISTTENELMSIETCEQNGVKFNKNEITAIDCVSNTTAKNKPRSIEPGEQNGVKFNKNEITHSNLMSISTTENELMSIETCEQNGVKFNKNEITAIDCVSNTTTKNKPISIDPCEQNDVKFNKNEITHSNLMSISTTENELMSIETCEQNGVKFNKNEINYPTVSFIKNNDLNYDSVCYSRVVNAEIDSKSKIKIEDDFYYNTTAIKYDFISEKSPELEINLFDVSNLSDSTITINKNNKSKKEFESLVKCNDIGSENILSSAEINSNNGFTQTKITHILKEEHTPVPAVIESEIETNVSTFFEPPQFKNLFDTSDIISSKPYQICPILPQISENNEPVNNLFDLPVDDIVFSLNNNSSDDDDDNRLLIEDNEPIVDSNINTNSTCIFKVPDNSKVERKINCHSSAASIKNVTTEIEFCEKKLTNTKRKQSSEINTIKTEKVSNPIVSKKKCVISNNNCENAYLLKEKKNSLDDCMSFEMCNDFYKIKSLNKSIASKNESLPKYLQDILKEMYVDELFVSTCQHMVNSCNNDDDDDQLKNNVIFQTDKFREISSKKLVCNIINTNEKKTSEFNQSISTNGVTLLGAEINYENQETNEPSNPTTEQNNSVSLQKPNDVKTKYLELRQSISTKGETISKSEMNNCNQQKKTVNPTITTQKSNSLQKPKNVKSNMKIRIHLREFILSDKSFDEILESKEFRSLRFFGEEEIASSIGVFIFEQIIDAPIITGLSVYRENYDQLNNEEKNKILASTNLNITCPKIMMLTSITLALVKMLRSDTLIELILNVIRRNVLKKQMNIDHTIDNQLIKQVVYFVDICVRLRLLKTLQIFIFDSMVFLPNKYCCTIFISLLLWKNCLPRSINMKEDPVIITVMSFLIAKKKLYSEETIGCDIFQRELINLLSCHFNYTFSIDMPTNFTQHIHKPDFFVSIVMFLKCCHPNDLVEFMVNCLFPIIDNYLNTQQNEMYAIQTMESINMAIKPFKITCNTTVATYLKKCKDPINGSKKNGKEHVYNTIHNSYKILQSKFIEYLNDSRPCSQYFEELLMSIILVLGSADYLTSCMSLMQWKPKNELSAILSKKIVIFKSILGDNIVWDKLYAIDDINTLKCLVNSSLLNKNVYDTIIQLYNLH